MLVHIAGNIKNLDVDEPIFRAIVREVNAHDSIIALNWIEQRIHALKRSNTKDVDWRAVATENIAAIKRSDVVIIEITSYNFSQGYQLAAALEHKKPTLVLYRDSLPGSIITGFTNQLFTHHFYATNDDLRKYVASFLKKNTVTSKDLRFNFFIDRKINRFLSEVEHETGKNKSEIIRNVIEKRIKKSNK